MSPSAKGTQNVSELSNNLNNPRIRTVITPDHQTGTSVPPENTVPPENDLSIDVHEKKSKFTLKHGVIASLAGIGIIAASAIGIGVANSNAEGPHKAPAENSAPATPSPSEASTPKAEASKPATDRYKGSDFERADTLPTFLQEANNDTPEDFAKLPKKTQIQWATWAGQYKPQFIEMFSAVSNLPEDEPYTVSMDSDVQTLIKDRSYEQRIAANFGTGNPENRQDNGKLDEDMVKKYMYAFTVVEDGSLNRVDNFVNSIESNTDGLSENVVVQAAGGAYDSLAEIAKSSDFTSQPGSMGIDGQSVNGYFVEWTGADGASTKYTIAPYETVDYKNQPIVVTIVDQAGL